MKRVFLLAGALVASVAHAQIPDVIVKIDALISYRSEKGEKATVRAYDMLGNYGTVGLGFTLEPGFRVLVSQRFQKIEGNADSDQFHELFIEDRGYWRLGKQVMPFGQNGLLKESTYGGRYETTIGWHALPASLAACDGGDGRQRGFMGRIGSRLGASFALGNRFGIDASSLTVVRRPEDSPGRNRGYGQIIGLDYSRQRGPVSLRVEHAWLRKGETAEDADREVTDVLLSHHRGQGSWVGVGWSRDTGAEDDFIRVLGSIPLNETAWIEPVLKIQVGEAAAFGASLRVRF